MSGSGGQQRASRAPIVASALVLAVFLTGCGARAPDTLTPHRPLPTADQTTSAVEPSTEATTERPAATAAEPTNSPDKRPVDYADLRVLSEELTAALGSGDVEQWMALTTLSGDEAQQQRDWFAAVQAVPMEVREMHPTRLLEEDVAGEVDGPLVEFAFRHQVTGADVVPVVEIYDLVLDRAGADGPYLVTAVSGSDTLAAAYPQLWDLGPVEVVHTEHVVLIGEEGSDVQRLADSVETATAALLADFPVDEVDRMVVTATDKGLLNTLFDFGEPEEGMFAGYVAPVAGSTWVEEGSDYRLPEVTPDGAIGARVVIDQEYAEEEWEVYAGVAGGSPVMRHEAMHVAMLLRYPDAEPPRWAVEGFAGWFEVTGDVTVHESHAYWYSTLVSDRALPDALPPSDYDEFFADDDLLERHYAEAANVFLYIQDAYGADRAGALGDALAAHDTWTAGAGELEDLFQGHLGIGLDEFEDDYVAWVHHSFGR